MFVVQPFHHFAGQLQAGDLSRTEDEDLAFRRGKALMGFAAGVAFFRIDTSASGDQWTQIELLATVGDVPPDLDAA